jgi:hypothetical protein
VNQANGCGFIGRRWRGETALAVLYWHDIVVVGSIINLLTGFAALMLAAQGVHLAIAAAVHFALLPYNAFLVVALWRTPRCSRAMAWTSALWLVVMTVV